MKLAGLVEHEGAGRKRFWACMHMFREEGLVKGYIEPHERDRSWDGMAAEMARLMGWGRSGAKRMVGKGSLPF